MVKKILLQADFEQQNVRPGVLEMLANNLKDDSDKEVSKSSIKESIAHIQKGNKVPYGPANHLLICILRSLRLVDDLDEDETFQDSSQVNESTTLGADESNGESTDGASASGWHQTKHAKTDEERLEDKTEGEDGKKKTPKYGRKENSQKGEKSKDEKRDRICRFYLNGKCKHGGECRFEHPKICPKFRQDGDCEVKGCGGGCDFIHPNVCHSSLRDKTCTYRECRFFHLKGTKIMERGQRNGNSNTPNWRGEQGNSKTGTNMDSKNRQPSLGQKTRKKGPDPNKGQRQKQKQTGETTTQSVTREEKRQLGQTLEAIMKRLDAMESRTTYYPQQSFQTRPQVQPSMSPAVPQLSTQTQQQWASQPPWMQSQTQM